MTDLDDPHAERLRTVYVTLDLLIEHLDGIERWYAGRLQDALEDVLQEREQRREERLAELIEAQADELLAQMEAVDG